MAESTDEGGVNLADFIGGIALGLTGMCAGIWAGVYIDGNAFPILLGAAGLVGGGFAGRRLTRVFPRLRSGSTVSAVAAGCGVSGLFLGWLAGDVVATFADLDRLYLDLVGAGLGLYFGIRIGLARQRATPPAA